jgi:hypothetical protein
MWFLFGDVVRLILRVKRAYVAQGPYDLTFIGDSAARRRFTFLGDGQRNGCHSGFFRGH